MVPHIQDITLIIDTQDSTTVISPRDLTLAQGTTMVMVTWDITLATVTQGTTMAMATWVTLVPLCIPDTTMVIIWVMPIRTLDTNFLDTMGMQYTLRASFFLKS